MSLSHLQLARGCLLTKPVRETAKFASDTLLLTLLVYILRSACTDRGDASRSADTSAQEVVTTCQLALYLTMTPSCEKP
ncbi:hypothetical protein P171DRAFT_61663 [Karstenula rhodostoma CBS 690.94]|uniref:Uncharacterized protein n=1 Tax=Karstenula rhodostoma CBS 690.94 TaxID=1392251 RepID=A0A9P4PFL4_9PLEO|nr:hypothetical protein P171DRAFT_61663 [Karstenula rhodostoma CBS 690.94]